MFNEAAYETLESFGESADAWDSSESAERFGRHRNRTVPRPNQGNAAVQTPQAGYATKAELEATANRLDGRIAVNTKAIDEVNGKVNGLGTSHNRLEANTKRGFTETKATTDKLGKQVESVKMAAMLLPLISTPKTKEITIGTDGTSEKVKVLIDDGDNFKMILPMMLMMGGGFGGQDSSGSSSNDMMLPMMLIAMSKK